MISNSLNCCGLSCSTWIECPPHWHQCPDSLVGSGQMDQGIGLFQDLMTEITPAMSK